MRLRLLPTDPQWLAMTDLDIMRESWRIHFYDLLQDGDKVTADVEATVIESDDEEFEQWVTNLEAEDEDPDWEPIK
jgi:hypothetical protein